MQEAVVDPTLTWIVWALLFLGTSAMTLIGTWLIVRRWEK